MDEKTLIGFAVGLFVGVILMAAIGIAPCPSPGQAQPSYYQNQRGESGIELDMGGGFRSRDGEIEYRQPLWQAPSSAPLDPC